MDYEKWMKKSMKIINSLDPGSVFEVKSLFTGIEWNQLNPGEKKSFGRYFSSKVKDGEVENVAKLGENKSHHNKYVKN